MQNNAIKKPIREEARKLLVIAWPIIVAQAATMLMGTVDFMMVGRLGGDAMAAVGIANYWVYGSMFFFIGLISGIDPLVTQAHGAGEGERAGRALQRGLILALFLSVPLILLWTQTGELLALLNPDDVESAYAAESYVMMQLPSVVFFLASGALRQYLQGRELVVPGMLVVIVSNGFNAELNYVLIFGTEALSFAGVGIPGTAVNIIPGFEIPAIPALGIEGAGIATGVTRIFAFLFLLEFVLEGKLYRGAWPRWRRDILHWRGFKPILALGFPIALQISLEMWAFHIAGFIAWQIGKVEIAAYSLVLNIASFSFMFVFGISQATTVRVGNLIGDGDSRSAARAGWVGVVFGITIMACFGALFVIGRNWLPPWYTNDAAVIAAAVATLPIAAAFQIFDGAQNACCGVLRGMGRPVPAVVANAVGYWLLALPLGYWLALHTSYGLHGVWGALTLGLVVVAVGLMLWLVWRGPASVKALEVAD